MLLAAVSQGGSGASVLMVEMDRVLSMGNSPLFHWTGNGSHCGHMAPPEIWVCTVETCVEEKSTESRFCMGRYNLSWASMEINIHQHLCFLELKQLCSSGEKVYNLAIPHSQRNY